MHVKKRKSETSVSSHKPVLSLVESSRDAWENVIAPWCERVVPDCWKRNLPAVIVVPTRGHANALKERLLRHGRSHLGLHFVTPTSLREMLSSDDATPRGEPEHLRLLLAIAATEMPDDLTAKAVARSPGPLLRALDRLQTAGWKFEQLALASFAPLVRRFHELMKKCGFVLPGEIDRLRLQQATKSARKFSDILITGFDGAHWAELVSPSHCRRAGGKRDRCSGRTARRFFRRRSLLDRFVGRNLRRSKTHDENCARRWRFAFQRSGNARRRTADVAL